jgi:hypothetical protein
MCQKVVGRGIEEGQARESKEQKGRSMRRGEETRERDPGVIGREGQLGLGFS